MLILQGRRVVYKALGWALRRMFCLKDNYFGVFTQYATNTEFIARSAENKNSIGDPIYEKYRPGKVRGNLPPPCRCLTFQSDAFGVFVSMDVQESLVFMSDEIFSARAGIAMPVPRLQMSLRSVADHLDLSLDATPTSVNCEIDIEAAYAKGDSQKINGDVVHLDGTSSHDAVRERLR